MRALGHTAVLAVLIAGRLSGQALAPETGSLGEIRSRGSQAELVLGHTTLQQVRQIYASRQLHEPLANARAPRTLTPAPRWRMGGATIAPRYRVDGADGYYTLYFDASERLVLAVNDQPRERLTRAEFEARYPKAKLTQHAGQASILEVPLEPCVTLSAMFTGSTATLTQAGYGYTCGSLVPASR
jgi:hypothetical protein